MNTKIVILSAVLLSGCTDVEHIGLDNQPTPVYCAGGWLYYITHAPVIDFLTGKQIPCEVEPPTKKLPNPIPY